MELKLSFLADVVMDEESLRKTAEQMSITELLSLSDLLWKIARAKIEQKNPLTI